MIDFAGIRRSVSLAVALLIAVSAVGGQTAERILNGATDAHVHILSPELIKIWKGLGIPFSRPEDYYSDIDAILKNTGTGRIDLISMAHVFSASDFGGFENERELVERENDFVASARDRYPKRIRAFCSVDPLRDYAIEEIERCRTKLKIDGIKLHHNANQVYLTEPDHLAKVKKVFAFAARHKLPVVLHFDNGHRKFGADDVKILVDQVLRGVDPIKLRIAHLGTSGGFNAKTKAVVDAFVEAFRTERSLRKHKITFDVSAVALDKDSEGVSKLNDAEFAEAAAYFRKLGFGRLVFATDYPLYTAPDYLRILRERVRLTDAEIEQLMKRK